MVLNPGKCYYMSFGLNTKNQFVLEDSTIAHPEKYMQY